jgi:hypothetical protein
MTGVDINVGVAINSKGGDCCTMLSLMSKDLCQRLDVKYCHSDLLVSLIYWFLDYVVIDVIDVKEFMSSGVIVMCCH